jgi:aminobenzoyl-glutamate utilization protein B
VPDVSKVWYFIRHTDLKGLQEAYNKVKETVKGAAIATGTDSKEKFITGCYGYLPNERLGELIYDNAKKVGSPIYSVEEKRFANQLRKRYGLEEIGKPIHEGLEYLKGSMGLYSQDDGDASWITPLGKLRFAFPKGIPVHGWGYTAVSGHSIGYKGMMFAAQTLAATALDIFMVPELLKEIKNEHENRTKGFEYKCLVPKDTKPITGDFMKYHVKTRW